MHMQYSDNAISSFTAIQQAWYTAASAVQKDLSLQLQPLHTLSRNNNKVYINLQPLT